MKNNKKICFISSAGGHLEEILELSSIKNEFNCYYVVSKSKFFNGSQKFDYTIDDFNHKNKIIYVFSIIKTSVEQLKIFCKEKPDYIITTGPGMVLTTCIIAKILKKKIIYIESFARFEDLSRVGKIIYKFADLFLVQNEELIIKYKKAIYRGALL